MILVDTSVWIDHLRRRNARLVARLEQNDVVMHPFAVGEIACGNLANREIILQLLHQLPLATLADVDEILGYLSSRRLYGKGIGYIDVHLLASATIDGTQLWTRDRRLGVIAHKQGCAWQDVE